MKALSADVVQRLNCIRVLGEVKGSLREIAPAARIIKLFTIKPEELSVWFEKPAEDSGPAGTMFLKNDLDLSTTKVKLKLESEDGRYLKDTLESRDDWSVADFMWLEGLLSQLQ